eukprot:COSAG05_NODE_14387_length_398_cov_0.846154_1_plen_29_part_01
MTVLGCVYPSNKIILIDATRHGSEWEAAA